MSKITLRSPVEMGKGEPITELELKPNGRALRGLKVEVTADGGMKYEPHALAVAGLKMAGHVAAAEAIVDRMQSIEDITEIAAAVLGFFAPSPTTGPKP